ncbi:MAG: hypothetical protein JOZ42_12845 [Acetobacteraceae bacterium]|nr:hypothetical protein [Acetobacteraceae bacterium]
MSESFQLAYGSGISHPAGEIRSGDAASGAVGPVTPISAIVGVSEFSFSFFNGGGTDNLKPGRPTTQTPPTRLRAARPVSSASGTSSAHS